MKAVIGGERREQPSAEQEKLALLALQSLPPWLAEMCNKYLSAEEQKAIVLHELGGYGHEKQEGHTRLVDQFANNKLEEKSKARWPKLRGRAKRKLRPSDLPNDKQN